MSVTPPINLHVKRNEEEDEEKDYENKDIINIAVSYKLSKRTKL
jgi:hypothetical protein